MDYYNQRNKMTLTKYSYICDGCGMDVIHLSSHYKNIITDNMGDYCKGKFQKIKWTGEIE